MEGKTHFSKVTLDGPFALREYHLCSGCDLNYGLLNPLDGISSDDQGRGSIGKDCLADKVINVDVIRASEGDHDEL